MPKIKRFKEYKDSIPSLHEQYDFIMDNFDFDYVLEFMKSNRSRREYRDDGSYIAHEWKVYHNGEFRVPTLDELRNLAGSLLSEVIRNYEKVKSRYTYIATGPFKALCRDGILELSCIIESWSYD